VLASTSRCRRQCVAPATIASRDSLAPCRKNSSPTAMLVSQLNGVEASPCTGRRLARITVPTRHSVKLSGRNFGRAIGISGRAATQKRLPRLRVAAVQYESGSHYCRCVSIKKANSFPEFINERCAWNVPVATGFGVRRVMCFNNAWTRLSACVAACSRAPNGAQKGRKRRKNRAVTRGYIPAWGITLFGSTPLTPPP
jgi:hypothetical protein